MTQSGAKSVPLAKKLTVEPLCSLEEADKRFDNTRLDKSHVTLRLTESTHIVSPEGETKFLFLKNVLMPEVVKDAWETLQKLKFRAAKDSRRMAIRDSGGGELLLGWIEFPKRGRGLVPHLTADSKNQWVHFRALWPLFWMIQHAFHKFLPEYADKQAAKAEMALESAIDFMLRDTQCFPNREELAEEYRRLEREEPEEFTFLFLHFLAAECPEYLENWMLSAKASEQLGQEVHLIPGLKDGRAMRGYTIPGTLFSTITVNQTALFRSHSDSNNLAGALGCLAAFGKYTGGDLCFPRFGVSCPLEPGDLLIGDTNREQHGNIGPLFGQRVSVVAYMRDDLAKPRTAS